MVKSLYFVMFKAKLSFPLIFKRKGSSHNVGNFVQFPLSLNFFIET